MRWHWGLFSGALACSGTVPEQRVEQQRAPIIDGVESGADEDGVVLLHAFLEDQGEVLCSASLVAPNLVLTARHCVSYLMPGPFSCNVRGELTDNPEGGGKLGAHLPAESIAVFGRETPRTTPLARGRQIISTLAEGICTNDMAFMVLDTAVELPVVPMRLDGPAVVGETGSVVGFGLTRGQRLLDYRYQPRASKSGIEIAELGPDSLEEGVTTAPPRALILRGPSGCVGDSGGPFLAASTGAVLGVYSLQGGDRCEAEDVYHQLVHVPPFRALIAEAFAAADATPTAEHTKPNGEGGAGGDAPAPAAGAGSAGAMPSAPRADDVDDSGCAIAPARSGARPALLAAALLLLARRRYRRA